MVQLRAQDFTGSRSAAFRSRELVSFLERVAAATASQEPTMCWADGVVMYKFRPVVPTEDEAGQPHRSAGDTIHPLSLNLGRMMPLDHPGM